MHHGSWIDLLLNEKFEGPMIAYRLATPT